MFVINTPLKIWIAAEACRFFSESRSHHGFELLLSTPLRERQIISGQRMALWRQFCAPLLAVFAWEILVELYNFIRPPWWQKGGIYGWPQIILMAADSVALATAGMWFGLKLKGRIRAILASLTLVVFIPAGISLAIMAGANLRQDYWPGAWNVFSLSRAFLFDPVVIAVTVSRLEDEFRGLALQR
jgi:hypothetical protein